MSENTCYAGAGGSFNPDPTVTFVKGVAGNRDTAPSQTGTVSVTAQPTN
jgi:hypothetical protein